MAKMTAVRKWACVAGMTALAPCLAQAEYRATFLESTKAWGSVVADFNGDGHDDFLISGHHKEDRIWYWTPEGYTPSAQVLPWVDRHDCDAADVNRDGRMDLFCAVGAGRGEGMGPKELWLQDADGVLQALVTHGAEDPYGRSRIPLFLDANHDGWPDVYLTNQSTIRTDGQINHNHLFLNQGGDPPHFAEADTVATGPRGWACAAKGDVNGDGWDDLVVCNQEGPPHIFVNDQAGNFTELATPAVSDVRWRWARLADMNGDGRDDLVVITGSTNSLQVWPNSGEGVFFDAPSLSTKFGWVGKAFTIGDFNRDGLKDIYVVQQQQRCPDTDQDTAYDLIFHGNATGGFTRERMTETFAGCGHRADTLDGDKVLLMNGFVDTVGPNYVVEKVSVAR
jgi:FG-GAP-like repeat